MKIVIMDIEPVIRSCQSSAHGLHHLRRYSFSTMSGLQLPILGAIYDIDTTIIHTHCFEVYDSLINVQGRYNRITFEY